MEAVQMVSRLLLFWLGAQLAGLAFWQQQQAMAVASAVSKALTGAEAVPVPVAAIQPKNALPSDLPLPFSCNSVTACKIIMDASLVKRYGDDNIIVDIAGQGPCHWSISRFNQGDLSPRLSPRHPFSQSNLGVPPPGDKGFETDDPKHFAVQAWKPHTNKGVVLVSVAENGQLWPDGQSLFYGTVAAVTESSGYGYSLISGSFEGESHTSIDVTVGKAGRAEEANIDVAVAWFPYSEGWLAGYIDAPSNNMSASWKQEGSHSPNLLSDAQKIVHYSEDGAELILPGVNGRRDGMLFTTSTDPGYQNNAVNIAVLRPVKKGWKVQIREDSNFDIKELAEINQWMFAFVYVPYTTKGLIGGHINGRNGAKLQGAGRFDVKRLAGGTYEITIESSPKNHRDGILMLQVVDEVPKVKMAPKCFLSYNYTKTGSFIVESHEFHWDKDHGDQFPFCDTSFYFMWVDFRNPVSPPGAFGEADPGQGDYFGIGFFLGMVMTVAMIVASYAVMKHLYYAPPGPSMIPLEDIGSEELEAGLLDGVDRSECDRGPMD